VKRAGNGEAFDAFGPIVEFLTPQDDDQLCVMRAVIPPGVAVPLHSHNDFEDFYILAGSHQVLAEGGGVLEWRDARAGDYVRLPGDVPHAHRNVSAEAAIDLIITTPRMGRFFREIARPLGSPPPTASEVARFVELAERYGYWVATPDENAAVGITVPVFSGSSKLGITGPGGGSHGRCG